MIRTELINRDILEMKKQEIESAYIDTILNLTKWPLLIENCKKGIETAEWERKEALEKIILQHEKNNETNEEALETLASVLDTINSL